LTPDFYESLLDHTWRRSGKILYRPDPRRSCCPHYTVRVSAANFRPAKDQRQAVNRFNNYVIGADYTREATRLYPRSRAETKKRANEFDIVKRVHEAEASSLKTPPQPSHTLAVTLEEDSCTDEKYKVFENYQRIVHKEEPDQISRNGFIRFLCESPLERSSITGADGKKRRLGSFHQCYRLDGVLVAVAVLDLLPSAVSSVYFFYHESIHKLSPGKVGAMREIAMALEDGYEWWYPGYYIPRCPKMRYKADYTPQEILDPETLLWSPLDGSLLELMEKEHYVSISGRRASLGTTEVAGAGLSAQQEAQGSGRMNVDPGEDEGDEDADVGVVADEDDSDDEGESLWKKNMPGVSNVEDMSVVDLDHVTAHLGRQVTYEVSRFRGWADHGIDEWPHFKTKIAQFIAALGPDLKDQVCIDMRYVL